MQRIQIEDRTDLASEIPLKTPYCIFIDPTNACNFKCKFCMNSNIKYHDFMSTNIFNKLIDDLQEFTDPIKTIRLYGFGEPLLNSNFFVMVNYAKASNKVLRVDTTTNAANLDSRRTDMLLDTGIDRINISIEAIGTDNYRKFTNNSRVDYKDIVNNVEYLYKSKSNKNTKIFVKINGDYLTDAEKEVFNSTFGPISDGHAIEHTMNCWRDFDVERINTEVGLYGQPLKEVMVCPYVFYSMFIHADGLASACFLDWNKKLVIGDAKIERLKSLWNTELLNDLRATMIVKDRKHHPICCNCSQLIAGMPVDLDDKAEQIINKMASLV